VITCLGFEGKADEKTGGGLTIVEQATSRSKEFTADTYLLEWQAFHHAITTRVTKWNSAEHGLADLSLAWEIANKGLKG